MTEETKMFSLILPVYNMASYLEKCLDSCLQQRYKFYEIICIDDGSTDDSGRILDLYEKQNKGIIRVLHTSNHGVSEARNYGIRAAEGLYCWFIDPDDTITKDILGDIAKIIQDYDLLLLPYSEVFEDDENKEKEEWWQLSAEVPPQSFFEFVTRKQFDKVWNYIIRRSILISNQLFFGKGIVLGEDRAFDFFLQQHVIKWAIYQTIAYHYIIKRQSASKGHIQNDKYTKRSIENSFWTALYYYTNLDKNINDIFLIKAKELISINIKMSINNSVRLGDVHLLTDLIKRLKKAGLYPYKEKCLSQHKNTIISRFTILFNIPIIAIVVTFLIGLKKRLHR